MYLMPTICWILLLCIIPYTGILFVVLFCNLSAFIFFIAFLIIFQEITRNIFKRIVLLQKESKFLKVLKSYNTLIFNNHERILILSLWEGVIFWISLLKKFNNRHVFELNIFLSLIQNLAIVKLILKIQ